MQFVKILLLFTAFAIGGCHSAMHPAEPAVPYQGHAPLSKQLIIQTQPNTIKKLEKDYAAYELKYMKTLSRSSQIFLFYVNPGAKSMDDIIRMLKRDIRITQVQTNKKVTPR